MSQEQLFGDDSSRFSNLALLFDASCGFGVVGERLPPIERVHCGYAGGFGPDNMRQEMGKVSSAVGTRGPVWIDMESNIRTSTPEGDLFDLSKVRSVLGTVLSSGAVFEDFNHLSKASL